MTQLDQAAVAAEKYAIPAHVWRIAGVVVFGAVMGMLDTSLVNIGLKTIGADLGASLDAVQWVASGYLLALGMALPICGWLGRWIGIGRLWLVSVAAFSTTSALCALAPDVRWLIALRVLQGLSAGMLIPAGQTLLGQAAGPQRLGRVMSVVGIAVVGAPTIGPTIGGVMLANLTWPWLFLINIPFGIVALVLGWRVLPRGEIVKPSRLDVVGLVLAGAGVSLVVYGLGRVGTDDAVATVVVAVSVGAVALVAFVFRSLRISKPLLDIRMFGERVFTAANIANFFAGAAMFGSMVLLPLYFQVLHGEGLVTTGLLLLSFGAGGIVALPLGGRSTDRYGGGIVAVYGGVLAIGATLPFVFLSASANPVLVQVLLFVRGVAVALAGMPLVSAAYAAVRRDQMADASVFVNIMQRIGGAVGVALVAVVLYQVGQAGVSVESGYRQAFGWLTAVSVIGLAASAVLWRHQRAGLTGSAAV